ncbi:O-acetylhomoserine aminocarboxypropyltransferase/cysteine synthase family protein [Salarchaeum sp. III]|uniref:O-acetylhomoserine aminocarboxypropyltransferase/cysteine synthase family protein n=1 Tax=Salarchaeum sp. III TaxID=3107927 RepID=UPI002ED885A6
MSDEGESGFHTQTVHAGSDPDPATGARATPIYQTTSYEFESADAAADLYALEGEGDIYTRISNPTVAALEDRIADLAGASAAVANASGMASFDALNFALASAGDNVVSASAIYGGTRAYLSHTARRRGVEARFVDTLDYDGYREAIDDDTAYVHAETIGNPALVTVDIERLADIAHDNGVPLVVDNTFATPALCRPLEHGADIVWHSTTKWLHGSGTTLGGVVVEDGSFDWSQHPEKYPEIAGENPAFHGIRFTERFPDAPFAAVARHRATRSIGHAQKPFDAWQTLQGLETLGLRMDRHSENARILAEYLQDHPAADWVSYPGLESHETHENATNYLDGGYGGMVTFGLGSFDAAKDFCESVNLASFLANVGDAKTLVIHPASTTHAQLSEDEQRSSGVLPDMVRVSVGIEDPADILADFDDAL